MVNTGDIKKGNTVKIQGNCRGKTGGNSKKSREKQREIREKFRGDTGEIQ